MEVYIRVWSHINQQWQHGTTQFPHRSPCSTMLVENHVSLLCNRQAPCCKLFSLQSSSPRSSRAFPLLPFPTESTEAWITPSHNNPLEDTASQQQHPKLDLDKNVKNRGFYVLKMKTPCTIYILTFLDFQYPSPTLKTGCKHYSWWSVASLFVIWSSLWCEWNTDVAVLNSLMVGQNGVPAGSFTMILGPKMVNGKCQSW